MSLSQKLGILGLAAALGCSSEGDVHYHIYDEGSGGSAGSRSDGSGSNGGGNSVIQIETCEDLVDKLYRCCTGFFQKYEYDWGISIESQLSHFIEDCTKLEYFVKETDFIQCVEEHSCAELNPAEHGGKPWSVACGE
ncbi:MAG: hypothetical protein AABY40_04080 [Nanoarchaeota archaeon]